MTAATAAPAATVESRVLKPAGRAGRLSRARESFTRVTGLTTSGLVLFFMFVGFWFLGWLVGGRPLYLISYVLLLVLIVSYVLGRRPLSLEGHRSDARPRFAEGETIDMQVRLTARRRLSTFILEEQVPHGLGDTPRIAVPAIDSGQEVDHSYQLTCSRRGVYSIGPLVVKWGDPFGLTQRQAVLAEPTEMLVHPGVELVEDRPLTRLFEDPPIRPPVSKPWPQGLEFYGMRAYTPGDDIRRIVWRAFARTGQLLVRESEQGITDKITIILDQDSQFHSRGEVSDSFETAVKAAASLGVRHLREGYQVTLEGNAQRLLPPVRGGNSQMRFLDALARVDRQHASLVDPIMRLVSDPSRDTHVVVITPRLHAEAASRLNFLLQRGASVLVAAVIWDDEDEDTLGAAAALGCQVVELRPNVPLAVSFRRETGAGVR